jgi:hypothetical protein
MATAKNPKASPAQQEGNSSQYEQALASGQVIVRKWWRNENSSKDQISVQFQQELERNESDPSSALLADSQGITGKARPTAIRSFAAQVIIDKLGSDEGNCIEEGQPIHMAKKLFPSVPVLGIQVVQTFEPNELRKNHAPVVNPTTGEVKMILGREVYQHEELIAGPGSFSAMTEAKAKEIDALSSEM